MKSSSQLSSDLARLSELEECVSMMEELIKVSVETKGRLRLELNCSMQSNTGAIRLYNDYGIEFLSRCPEVKEAILHHIPFILEYAATLQKERLCDAKREMSEELLDLAVTYRTARAENGTSL